MTEEDRLALRALLARSGGGQPRKFRHYLYLPERAKGEALAADLRRDGFEVTSRMGADDVNWHLLVQHLLIPDEQIVERLAGHLGNLAEAMGGEYDGWEADAQ